MDLLPSYNRIWYIHFQEDIFEHLCLESISNTYTFSPKWKQSRGILGNSYNALLGLLCLRIAFLQGKRNTVSLFFSVLWCPWILHSLIFISIIISINRKLHFSNKYSILFKAWECLSTQVPNPFLDIHYQLYLMGIKFWLWKPRFQRNKKCKQTNKTNSEVINKVSELNHHKRELTEGKSNTFASNSTQALSHWEKQRKWELDISIYKMMVNMVKDMDIFNSFCNILKRYLTNDTTEVLGELYRL